MIDDEYKINQIGNNQEKDEIVTIRNKISKFRLGIIIEIFLLIAEITFFYCGMTSHQCDQHIGNEIRKDETKIAAYNSEFEKYSGTVSGSQVRALCDLIRSHNNANVVDETLNISIQYGEGIDSTVARETAPREIVTIEEVQNIKSKIKAGKRYNVKFGYDEDTGFIVDCCIEEL